MSLTFGTTPGLGIFRSSIAFENHSFRERQSPRILIINFAAAVQESLADYLRGEALQVVVADDDRATSHPIARDVDLVILALESGQDAGLEMLRRLRRSSTVPVIVTGHRCTQAQGIIALELGADDFLQEPISLRELLARVRTVLRRVSGIRTRSNAPRANGVARFDGWTLDRHARRLTCPKGSNVSLTKGEFALLLALVSAPGQALSREFLLQATRIHEDVYDRSIDVQILRLRRKLEVDPRQPRIIQTERGFGYTFAVPVEDGSGWTATRLMDDTNR